MQTLNDFNRSRIALEPNGTLIAVIEMSQASWLVGAIVPRVERHPLKKLAPDAEALLRLYSAGGRKPPRPVGRLPGSRSPTRPGGTVSGWPDGCRRGASKPL